MDSEFPAKAISVGDSFVSDPWDNWRLKQSEASNIFFTRSRFFEG